MDKALDFDFLGLPSASDALGEFHVSDTVRIFPMESPWIYVLVPPEHSEILQPFKVHSLIPIRVTLGKSCWDTSLIPLGKSYWDTSLIPTGKSDPNYIHFIPLKAPIRKAENIQVGDLISLIYRLRKNTGTARSPV